ncbi:MAG: sodium/proton antiporter NhaB [bacterium]
MQARTMTQAFQANFLGNSPDWFKMTIIGFLIMNPILLEMFGGVAAGWALVAEFIFTLAMALKCYPLQPGGLLAIEAVVLGMTSPATVMHKIEGNLEVILLLIFMVAGIYFMKDLLLYVFSKVLLRIRSKIAIALMFSFLGAILSAFLDALTVTAVVIAVASGFYGVYHQVASGKRFKDEHDPTTNESIKTNKKEDLARFRRFLRSLVMHAAVGTALGGVCTLVGEPQNLLIATKAHWQFGEFFLRMAPVTMPVLISGFMVCILVEKFKIFGYGEELPESVRQVMQDFDDYQESHRDKKDYAKLISQGITAVWLVLALGLHLAAVGLIGLTVIIFATVFTGVNEEHQLGAAFEEALPFTALLAVFFAIVAVIYDQDLFGPVIEHIFQLEPSQQMPMFYIANGVLSAISDNVFVATVYIDEVIRAFHAGEISRDTFDLMAVAINTGTNIPSVATPNGQAAFLFLLTSALAPLLRLSYGKMVLMALPYTIVMSLVGFASIVWVAVPATQSMYDSGLIIHHHKKEHVIEAASKPAPELGHH